MNDQRINANSQPWAGPRMAEFVAMMAALMATGALAIDAMLPALPAIGESLRIHDENSRQLVVSAYLLGFGVAQLFYGPLADRLGRKAILIISLGFYCVFAVAAGLSTSFAGMLAARAAMGAAASGGRTLVMSVVRDRFHGNAMARVMSLVSIVFMLVPVIAPSFGQLVLLFGNWRVIFFVLAGYSLLILTWLTLRLPETLHPDNRLALTASSLWQATVETMTHRASIGNTVAITLVQAGIFAFINSIQQIVFDVFKHPNLIGVVFASIAGALAISSYTNSRLVERIGARALVHRASLALVGFLVLHLAVAGLIGENLWVFIVLQALTMGCFGLIGGNLASLAMAPVGHIAGTAAAVQGVISTVGGTLIGLAIGQAFNGTTIPFLAGMLICSALGAAVAYWANRD